MNTATSSPTGTKQEAKAPSLSDFRLYKPDIRDYKLKVLIYGDPGIGKTTLAATANGHPNMREVLFVGCEPGTLSISDESVIKCPKPDVVDFDGFDALGDLVWALRTQKHPYKTLVLDTFSELQKKSMDEWLQKKSQKAKDAGQIPKNETLDDVFLEDWGKNTQHMRRVGRELRDLPMHVILTAHVREPEPGKPISPSLTPKLAESIVSFMDVVGFLYFGKKDPDSKEKDAELVRKLQVGPLQGYMTKDRSPGGKLGGVVVEPNLPKMLDLILAGTTDERDQRKD